MNTKIIVRLVLGTIILLSSFAFWASLSAALNNGPDWIVMSVWSLSAFLVLAFGLGLAYLMEEKVILFYALPAAIILPALVFLKNDAVVVLIAAVALIFLAIAAGKANFEKSLRIKFAPLSILRQGLAPAITGLSLLSSLIFYGAPLAQTLGENVIVPRQLFDALATPAMDFALRMNLPAGADIKNLPLEFKKEQEAFLDKLYDSLNTQIEITGRSIKKWLPLGAAVSLFFTFKVVGTILSWLAILLAWLIFRILLWIGVVKINKVVAEKEVIEI